MGQRIQLPWGNESLDVRLPDNWKVLGELRPGNAPAAPVGSCLEALAQPIGTQRLSSMSLSGKRIVVVVDDHSRPTPVNDFIMDVLSELRLAGAEDQHIDVMIATGIHRASRPEEVAAKLGKETMARLRWRCHNAYDPEGLAYVGTTSRGTRVLLNKLLLDADLIICLGSLEPHLLLGFGGGLKMIIPGCAGAETIGRNHLQGVDPDHFDFVGVHGEHSPMRLDLEEGVGLLGRQVFIVNAVMNEEAKPTRFFCGDPIQAHRAGEAFVESKARTEVPEQSDVVLTNSHPMDVDLRQSVKCLGNTLHACKPGGIMMGCVRSEKGVGEMPFAKKTLPYPLMRTLLRVLGKRRVLPFVEKVKKGEPVEEVCISHFGLQMLRRNHLALFTDSPHVPENIGRKMGLARSFTDVQDMVAWTATKAPAAATVWVFPCGGTTYAYSSSSS
jgi:lactate racemase